MDNIYVSGNDIQTSALYLDDTISIHSTDSDTENLPEEISESAIVSQNELEDNTNQSITIPEQQENYSNVHNDGNPTDTKPLKPKESPVTNKIEQIDEEAECCPICFEPWTNSGEHRLSSLKCGHLFGQFCIEKWLKGQGGKCPQCNAKATKKDIRIIYAKALRVCDTSEKDRALSNLEKEKETRKKTEMQYAETKLQLQLAVEEVKKLKDELERMKYTSSNFRNNTTFSSSQSSFNTSMFLNTSNKNFILEKHIGISEAGGCRVMSYSHHLGILCVSQPSSNQLFPGFGVKKLNSFDFKTSQFVCLHSKVIRDLSFNKTTQDGLLLSCSLDKSIKVTSLYSNAIVQTYNCDCPIWSCVWDESNSNYFYAGLQTGAVNVYDIRNTSQEVKTLTNHSSRSPVLSVQFVSQSYSSSNITGESLIAGQLEKSVVYEKLPNDEFAVHPLPFERNITSLNYEATTQHILVTLRPNANNNYVRHSMFKLSNSKNMDTTTFKCDLIHTFHGGSTQKHLSRNRLLPYPESDGNLLACTCDEASQSVLMWDVTTGSLKQKLNVNTSVYDLCYFERDDSKFLATLNEKQVSVFKWV